MFGIGLPELLLIMGLGLVVLGPDKLPDLAKQLAKGMVELKRTANALKDSLQEELEDENGGSPLVDELRKNAGQPWRGLDGQGAPPSDVLPDGFDEFNNGIGVVGVNGPVAAPGAADSGESNEAVAGEEGVAAAEDVAEPATDVVPDAAVETDSAEPSDPQEKTTA